MSPFTKWVLILAAFPLAVLTLDATGLVSFTDFMSGLVMVVLMMFFLGFMYGIGLGGGSFVGTIISLARRTKNKDFDTENLVLAGLAIALWAVLIFPGVKFLGKGPGNMILEPPLLGLATGALLSLRTALFREPPGPRGKWLFRAIALAIPILFAIFIPYWDYED